MSEWWTYRLGDFLMFSPEVYWRMVARHNAAWWPLAAIAATGPVVLMGLLRRAAPAGWRAALLLLALAWAWVGWAFHWRTYSEIFLGAPWLGAGCAVQALLLLAPVGLPLRGERAGTAAILACAAAAAYPLLAPATGHGWREAEVFGLMPEPTSLATLGALLALPASAWTRALLAVMPVLSLLLGLATRWLLAS